MTKEEKDKLIETLNQMIESIKFKIDFNYENN